MNIIPKPKKLELTGGMYLLPITTRVYIEVGFSALREVVTQELSADGFAPTLIDMADGADLCISQDTSLPAEEYRLTVKNYGVQIVAGDYVAAVWGFFSLIQMGRIRFKPHGGAFLQCVVITDRPLYAYRGIMLDAGRHYIPMPKIFETLDMMAYLKLNFLHWHLTEDQGWRAEIKRHPRLTAEGSIRAGTQHKQYRDSDGVEYGRGLWYSQDDMRAVVSYAAARGIQVIPEIDMPGHLVSAISVYPQLSCEGKQVPVREGWGVEEIIGCVGGEHFLPFVFEVLDELVEIFPAPYFHIGGDEVPKAKWKQCPKCQAKMKELSLQSEEDLQGWFNTQVSAYLQSKGKAMLGWSEIMESAKLPSDTVIQWWRKSSHALNWIKSGNRAILSYNDYMYLDYPYTTIPLSKIYGFTPAKLGITADSVQNVWGVEAPLWTEHVRDAQKYDFNLYPRMHAVAEVGWTDEAQKDYDEFTRRLQQFLQEMGMQGIGYSDPTKYNPVGRHGRKQRKYVAADSDDWYRELRYEPQQKKKWF